VELNLSRAKQLVLELMAIPGRSGDESAVASYVRDKLLAAGAPADAIKSDNAHTRSPLKGNVGNLLLKLPGTRKGLRRLLSAHPDTVPICVGCKPKIEGEFVRSADPNTALGADNRAGTATILAAALEILERNLLHPPLTFCWFVQEEVGLHGARYMQQSQFGKPAMGFKWDGGAAEKLTIGATGGYRMEIAIDGIASHRHRVARYRRPASHGLAWAGRTRR
jgi:tripeptide aminopeptidase